jgi:hypothetical protein
MNQPNNTRPVEEHVDLASLRLLNESAIRAHALQCSAKFRANKFTRVGEDFVDEVKADVEAFIRKLRMTCQTSPHDPLPPGDLCFTTGLLSDRVMGELNHVIARIVQQKVQRQPTVGSTLRGTH